MTQEIEEADPKERRRTVIARRIGITVFTLFLVAALAGLVGKGRFSKVKAATKDRELEVEHLRFIRYQGPTDLKIYVAAAATAHGIFSLQLSRTFVDEVEIERIEPEPESTIAGPVYVTYLIRAETNKATEVKVRFSADHFGRKRYSVGLASGASVPLQHFAYP
jgi:hypothetical protein